MKKFEITSAQNPKVKHWIKLRDERSYRLENQTVLIEGKKVISEIPGVKKIIAISETQIPTKACPEELYIVTSGIMKKISGVESPEGILAELPMPKQASFEKISFLVALDGVSDPGNMGTLLRTALALGWEGAFILNNSCDPFNDKALRAAKGALFRLPFRIGSWEELKKIAHKNHLTPLMADIKGDNLLDWQDKRQILLVLGNEAHGASKEAKTFCKKIMIPMPGEMESLNVGIAGGILMFTLKLLRA